MHQMQASRQRLLGRLQMGRTSKCSTVQNARRTGQALGRASMLLLAAVAPFRVVITGSTKGIGRALAEEFLRAGDNVVISSRQKDAVSQVVTELQAAYGQERVHGIYADVSKGSDVRALARHAIEALGGGIDVWISNAGSVVYGPLVDSDDGDLSQTVNTNLLGVLLCMKEAIRVMRTQPSGTGHIFNMDGAGASGSATPRFAAYGATKRSLEQLSSSVQAELLQLKLGDKICVHNLSPGMVSTDLLMSGASTSQAKWFINCLAEEPVDCAAYLVPRIRQVVLANSKNLLTGQLVPSYIKFLTPVKAYTQILQRVVFGQRKDRYVAE